MLKSSSNQAEEEEPPKYNTLYENIKVFSLSLNFTDRLRVIGAPQDLIPKIRSTIQTHWGNIQKEKYYYGALEFKLEGNPWSNFERNDESVRSRRLIYGLISCMISNGWNLLQGADISKCDGDKDVLFFENAPPDPDVQLIVLSLNLYDRIRLINAPPVVIGVLKAAVMEAWPKGIQNEKDYYGAHEIKVNGNPWVKANFGSESVLRCVLLAQIIANFKAMGYKLYASLDMSGGTEGSDLETWVFRKIGPFYQ